MQSVTLFDSCGLVPRSSGMSFSRIGNSYVLLLKLLSGNLDEASNMAMAIPENELDIGGLSTIGTFRNVRELLGDASKLRLGDILALLRRSWSTDPRDMIYGLLELVPDSSIIPDYSHASTRDVFMDLVHRCIMEEKSLDIITLRRETSAELELPSWVPDWTITWVMGYGEDYKMMENPDPPPFPLILKYGSGALLRNIILNASSGPDSSVPIEAWTADASSVPSATIEQSPFNLDCWWDSNRPYQ